MLLAFILFIPYLFFRFHFENNINLHTQHQLRSFYQLPPIFIFFFFSISFPVIDSLFKISFLEFSFHILWRSSLSFSLFSLKSVFHIYFHFFQTILFYHLYLFIYLFLQTIRIQVWGHISSYAFISNAICHDISFRFLHSNQKIILSFNLRTFFVRIFAKSTNRYDEIKHEFKHNEIKKLGLKIFHFLNFY